jgi:hypothetical protein
MSLRPAPKKANLKLRHRTGEGGYVAGYSRETGFVFRAIREEEKFVVVGLELRRHYFSSGATYFIPRFISAQIA